MNVIIVISNKSMGGAQRVSVSLCEWLNKQNNTSACIVSLSETSNKKYDMSSIKSYDIFKKNKVKELIKIIKKEKPDLVVSMGVPMSIYTVPACIGTKTKHIISERNDPSHFAGKRIVKIISRFLMKYADGYVFQTNDAKKYYKKLGKKSSIIPNPIFGINQMPSTIFKGERAKTIVSVGRLNKQKNFSLLIDAFSNFVLKHPDYKLCIWGEGEERENLEQKILNLKLEKKILLPGNTNDIYEKIYDSCCFVLCSNFEGMPNALMEAMALGLPCISTDCPCGGPRELIFNKENGVLIPINDKIKLSDNMEKIINNPDFSKKIEKGAFDIRKKYNVDVVCKKWLDFFKEVINKKEG